MSRNARRRSSTVRVAVAQAAPVLFDRSASIEKAAALIRQAGREGARLILLPEAFVPGYPRGLDFEVVVGERGERGRRDWARYRAESVIVPGPDTDVLGKAARDADAYLAVGIIERSRDDQGGTIFCALLYFGPDGRLLGKHRKLKPTAAERVIWGEGDGAGLIAVETPFGKIGGLICWENYMPFARAALYAQGVSIYLAPTADAREAWQATLRHIAREGGCFVLGCNQFMTRSMYPRDWADRLPESPEIMCAGGSAIVSPMGEVLAGPLRDREGILYADLDLDEISRARFDFDVTGHYARPDVFQLHVNREPRQAVHFRNDSKRTKPISSDNETHPKKPPAGRE